MRAKLISIGNSKGLRIPKAVLQAARLKDEVDLTVEPGRLVITPARRKRQHRVGWARAIRAEIQRGGVPEPDSVWLDVVHAWDDHEWKW